jgi:hypothetical protein
MIINGIIPHKKLYIQNEKPRETDVVDVMICEDIRVSDVHWIYFLFLFSENAPKQIWYETMYLTHSMLRI